MSGSIGTLQVKNIFVHVLYEFVHKTIIYLFLAPYTVYQFKILAATAKGFGPSFSQPKYL